MIVDNMAIIIPVTPAMAIFWPTLPLGMLEAKRSAVDQQHMPKQRGQKSEISNCCVARQAEATFQIKKVPVEADMAAKTSSKARPSPEAGGSGAPHVQQKWPIGVCGWPHLLQIEGMGPMSCCARSYAVQYVAISAPQSLSTIIRPPGTSPNTSGAYIASTRVAGRAKSPALLRRTVYSTEKLPLGTRA